MPMLRSVPSLAPFRYLRQALPWLLALAVATCTADQGGPTGSGVGYFSFRPVYHLAGGASLSQFGIVADSVRIRLTRPVDQLVLDTTLFFPPDSASLHLALPVELQQSPETLTAVITISAGGIVLFTDSVEAEVKDGPAGSTTPPTVVFDYVGPGSNVGTLTIQPGDTTVSFLDTLFFTATALDSSAAPVSSFYVGWKSSDTTLAKINASGRFIAPALRGSVRVIGTTPTGIADTTLVTFAPVPVTIYADSGNTQLGIVGDSLTALLVARVMGADSLGIAGIAVKFQAVTAGGAVRDTLILTDAQGRARTRAVLGDTARAYSYTATALGTLLPVATFTGTAGSAAAATIAIIGGNGQIDTTGKTLGLPLTVNVRDGFGNRVGGAMVIFTRTAGSGTVGNDTVLTAVDGDASTTYTLGSVIGIDSISAQLAGTSAFVVFAATGVSNLPTQIIQGLGGGQSAVADAPFTDSLTVQVLDNNDNPVGGVQVHWAITTGIGALSADSTPTDGVGHAAVRLIASTVAGPLQVAATVTGIALPVNFNETITPAAAAALSLISGDGQSANALTVLPLPLVVHVADGYGNAVPGVLVAFTVTAGAGTLDSATATTDATGNANSGAWTLGAIAGGNTVIATSALVPADTVTFNALGLPAAANKIWTGAVSNAWITAGNWNPSGVPTTSDNVFIPAGVTAPFLGSTSNTNDLTIEAGATLNTGSFVLTSSGNVDIEGSISGAGSFILNGTGKTLRGTTNVTFVNPTGTLTLNGPLTVSNSFNISAGSLTVGGQTLQLNNGLTVSGGGLLVMTNPADSVDVFGPALFNSGTATGGSLTNGVIVYRGSFTQTAGAFANYAASPGHRSKFAGGTVQTVSMSTPSQANSHFGDVEFANGTGITLATNIAAAGPVVVSAGVVTGAARTAFLASDLVSPTASWNLTTTEWSAAPTNYPDSIPGSVNLIGAWTLTKPFEIGGGLTINTGGTLTVGGQALRVVGGFTSAGNGLLVMTNAADSVDIGGAATFNAGVTSTGTLSAGVLVLRGNFTQTAGAFTNFAPSGTHKTRFLGVAGQSISFSTPGSANSRFQDLEFGDPAGVTLASTVTAMGPTSVSAGTVTGIGRTINLGGDLITTYAAWQISTTLWGASPTVYPDSLPRNVTVFNAFTLNKPFKIDSSLTINSTGVLTLNGNAFRVGGSLTQGGILRMQNTADTLVVGGLLTVNSGVSGVGDLTGGLLSIRGGMNQTAGAFANFQAAGSHTTRFEAGSGQAVSFSTAGAANSRFQNLELADSVSAASALYVAGDVTVLTGGKLVGVPTITLAGNLTDPTDLGWRASNTLFNGTPTFLPDSMVTNLQLSGTWTVGRRTVVTGNMNVLATGVLALNADTLLVTGSFAQTGTLTMAAPSDLLDVGGLFTANSSVSGTGSLSDGLLILRNGFNQTAGSFTNFAPSGSHTVRFAGSGGHGVVFSTPSAANSRFQNVEVLDSLTLTSAMTVMGSTSMDPAGRMLSAVNTATLLGDLVDPSKKGWRVANTSVPGTQALPDTMATNLTVTGNWTLATGIDLTGTFTVAGTGVVDLNGHRMHVSGNVTQSGRLRMLQPQDSLDIGGDLLVNSAQNGVGDLVDGRLILHGAFNQTAGSFTNFAPSTSHLTAFLGSGGHGVTFSTPDNTQSHFHQVEVRDSLAVTGIIAASGSVTIDSIGRVAGIGTAKLLGGLVDSSLAGWRMGTTQLDGKFQPIPSTLVTNLVVRDSLFLSQPTTVTGNMSLTTNGYLGFGGHGLGVSGNFTQTAQLAMIGSGDSLEVGGNFLVNGSFSDTMTAGVIVLHGGFSQTAGTFTNYVSVAPHRTRFTGPAARNIDFTTPTQSMFGDLEVDATGAITLGGNFRVTGTFKKPAGPTSPFTATAQRLLQVNGLAVDGATFDRIRIQLNSAVNVMQFDNVAFTNQDPTLTQLSLELPGLAGDTLKLNSVAFDGVPTTGRYVFVTDSVADGAVATVAFYNSTPLNGSLYAAVNGAAGDPPSVLWSNLEWQTQPLAGTELIPFFPAPQLRAVDPSGNLLTGFTGTVTLGLFTDPSAGSAVLGGNSVAAVGGIATFDSLTLSLAGVGYQLQANAGGLGQGPPSAPFDITVPLPVGTTTAFTNGGGDNDWFNAANWTFGVPDSADNVFVFPGQSATVNAPANANRIVVGSGAGILLNAPLTVDSTVDAGNTIAGGGQLVARGTGYLSGAMGGLVVSGSYLVPVNDTLTADYINISGASAILDPGSSRIVAIDSLRTEAGGRLDVNDAGAVVSVQGRARFTGGTPALVTGTLEVSGDFSQEENVGAFSATPGFVTVFNGGGTQTATFFSPDTLSDHFGDLRLTGGGILHLAGATVPILGNIDIQGGHVVIDTTALLLGTVTGSTGAFMEGATLLIRDNFAFGGVYTVQNTVFIGSGQTIQQAITPFDTVYVQGTASLAGNVTANVLFVTNFGQFDLGGHRLDVTADFGTGSGGIFDMNDAADTVTVGGTFYAMGGSTNGLLTDGLLQIAGSFYEGSTPADTIPVEVQGPPPALDAFRATGTHVTRFIGGPGVQRIIFFGSPVLPADPFSTNNSRFGVLELIDGVDSVASTLPVDGDLFVDSARVVNAAFLTGGPAVAGNILVGANVPEFTVSNVSLGGVLDFQPAPALYQVGTTLFFGAAQAVPDLPYQDLEVALGQATLTSDLTVQNVRTGVPQEGTGLPGDLRLAGHKLTVAGNFTTTGEGTFTMDDPADSLDVTGNSDLGGGVTTALTAGTFVVRGDLYLQDSNYVASGTHHTVMAAPVSQQLWITTSPTPSNQFNFLTVQAGTTVNFNAFSVGPLVVADTFAIHGFFLQANPGKQVLALGDLYVGTAAGITVDELELHKSLDVDASSYSVLLTRYAGVGQIVSRTATYNDLEITGTAALDTTITVNHDATIRNQGVLDIAGHTLAIAHDLFLGEDGLLNMTNAADSVNVGFTATFDGGNSDGWLTAGVLTFNYFQQLATGSPNSFRATGAHRAVLLEQNPNDATNMIQFATPGPAASQFQELELNGAGGFAYLGTGGIFVADSFYVPAGGSGGIFGSGTTMTVAGPIAVQTGTIPIQLDTLELRGAIDVPSSSLNNVVTRFAGVLQAIPDTQSYQQIQVTGSAHLESTANASGFTVLGNGQFTMLPNQQLIVSGDFATLENGTLQMNSANADLFVLGNATFGGGAEAGLLSDGTIRVVGNFTELPGTSNETFTTTGFGTGVHFQGSTSAQVVTLDPATIGNFRGVGITNPFGIQVVGNMVVTDSVGTVGPITGDSLSQFGSFFMNPGASVSLRVLKTSGLFVGTPSSYTVGRTHMVVGPNGLPNVPFDTLVIAASGTISAFSPISANALIIAGPGSVYSGGSIGVLDLGVYAGQVTHTITGDLRIEGTGAHLEIAEDTVNVGGDFYTSLGGTLRMSGPGALNVTGSTLFGGASEQGLMSNGTLQVGSGITQQAFSSPSSFRMDGTTLDLPVGPVHLINIQTPDSSWLPDISSGAAGTLSLVISGRARVAGGISGYGVSLSGDSLWIDGLLTGGPASATASLAELRVGQLDQFGNFGSFVVGTGHITGAGALPFNLDPTFDSLFIHDSVQGQLSQIITTKYLEVTGPGDPRNLTGNPGRFYLIGGDGNTQVDVNGDVVVRGTGAGLINDEGLLQATGGLTVTDGAYLAAFGGFSGGAYIVNGDVLIDGASTKDSLIRGSLSIGGDFTQLATVSTESFAAGTAFITGFVGSTSHKITFATPSMAQSHFGTFAVDSGTVATNGVDLQSWVFADSVTIFAVGAAFQPRIVGNGNRLTTGGGYLLGADLDGVHLQFEDNGSFTGPNLGNIKFTGYSGFGVPQITLNTSGGWLGTASWAAMDFDDAGPSPWLVINNGGGTIAIDVHTPDTATLASNTTITGGPVALNPLP